jgi:hypothetical protein
LQSHGGRLAQGSVEDALILVDTLSRGCRLDQLRVDQAAGER